MEEITALFGENNAKVGDGDGFLGTRNPRKGETGFSFQIVPLLQKSNAPAIAMGVYCGQGKRRRTCHRKSRKFTSPD